MNQEPTKQKWEDELFKVAHKTREEIAKKAFGKVAGVYGNSLNLTQTRDLIIKNIKIFISQLLKSQREEIVGGIMDAVFAVSITSHLSKPKKPLKKFYYE